MTLLDIALYIYLFGIAVIIIYQLFKFSQGIKFLTSTPAFFFMVFEVLKDCVKGILWPVLGMLWILQAPFAKGTVDNFNDAMARYNGIEDDDYKED